MCGGQEVLDKFQKFVTFANDYWSLLIAGAWNQGDSETKLFALNGEDQEVKELGEIDEWLQGMMMGWDMVLNKDVDFDSSANILTELIELIGFVPEY
jgi:hypothetical protein